MKSAIVKVLVATVAITGAAGVTTAAEARTRHHTTHHASTGPKCNKHVGHYTYKRTKRGRLEECVPYTAWHWHRV